MNLRKTHLGESTVLTLSWFLMYCHRTLFSPSLQNTAKYPLKWSHVSVYGGVWVINFGCYCADWIWIVKCWCEATYSARHVQKVKQLSTAVLFALFWLVSVALYLFFFNIILDNTEVAPLPINEFQIFQNLRYNYIFRNIKVIICCCFSSLI